VLLDNIDPICFLHLVTHLHALIRLPIPYIPIGLGLWLVDLLSPAVRVIFHLIWCWVWLVSLWECLVSYPSRCDLTVVRIDVVVWARFGMVETVRIRQVMWIVMLESAKDRILGVDTLGQHVPPRVRYGMTCWLTRKALVSLPCSKSGTGMAIPTRPQGAREAWGYSLVRNRGKP
jgi:hypothetical protein